MAYLIFNVAYIFFKMIDFVLESLPLLLLEIHDKKRG
jgi:hypothetical protein